MARYDKGDYIKVEFDSRDAGLPSEWMWVRVHHCDEEHQVVFGRLDNEPVVNSEELQLDQEIASTPEVMECYLMTGTADYLLRIVAADVDDLERIHSTRLTRLAGVARVNSSIAMRQVVRRAELPVAAR